MSENQSRRDVVKAALPGSALEIMKKTSLGRTSVWRWLKDLHDKGESHIVSWQRIPNGGPFVPVYEKGPGKDARCKLKPFTNKEKSARFRATARKDGRWEDYKAKMRGRHAADRADYTKDPLLGAFFRPHQ